jgi:poly-gamma-glutamate capsule biosynthesis protein CapA/YwtB (metallophosphatase superfamily)
LLNLETAITKTIDNSDIPTGKGINYHMHVDNFVPILSGLPVQTSNTVATLANNHGLDFGRQAFEEETIPFFTQTSPPVQMIGCGRTFQEAAKPAILECAGTTVQVFAVATGCSGTPQDWWATDRRSGIVGLPSLASKTDVETAMKIVRSVLQLAPPRSAERPIRIFSIHWGPNWALGGESDQQLTARREFAHRLIDECGVDLIYGHSIVSSHSRNRTL